jgi:N-acetylglucosamine kinase-like BadF-type ATPase
MKEKRLYVGIDGGGTYTKAVVVSSDGELIFRTEGKTINYYAVSFDVARKNLEEVFDCISDNVDASDISRVFIGCSALDRRADGSIVKELMGRYSHIPTDMDSDLYVALFGHTFGSSGAMIISGTGSMGVSIDENGAIRTCGGWGYAFGDEGSAYAIAVDGLRRATKMADGREEKTELYEAMLKFYGINEPYCLIDKIYDPALCRNEVAKFAVAVAECAERGDAVAAEILTNAADELALLAVALIDATKGCRSLAIYGGVFQNNEFIRDRFFERLALEHSEVNISFPRALPEFGAVAAAMKADGILNKELIEKICKLK